MRDSMTVGGRQQMFFPAGTPVPGVNAEDNTGGYYSLPAREFNAIVNP